MGSAIEESTMPPAMGMAFAIMTLYELPRREPDRVFAELL